MHTAQYIFTVCNQYPTLQRSDQVAMDSDRPCHLWAYYMTFLSRVGSDERRKKKNLSYPISGCLIGILTMGYNNPDDKR